MRRYRVGVTLALVAVLLSACSGGAPSDRAITLWMYPIFPDSAVSTSFWAEREREFERDHQGLDLRVELLPWQNNDVKAATAFAAGNPPDLILFRPEQISSYAARGLLRPLDDVVGPVADRISASDLASSSYRGRPYMVPLYLLAMTMSCNRDVLREAGFDAAPRTWSDVRTIAERLRPQGKFALDYPAGLDVSLNLNFYPFLWQAGGSVYTRDGARSAVNSAAGKRALRFLVELYRDGAIDSAALTESHSPASGPMGQGRAACSPLSTLAEVRQLQETLGERTVLAAPPLTDRRQAGFGYPSGLVLTSGSGNREGATKFLRYMLRPDVLSRLCELSGFLPTRSDVRCRQPDAAARVYADSVDSFLPGEPRATATQAMAITAPHLQAALLGDESPDEALDAAAAEVDGLLERRGTGP